MTKPDNLIDLSANNMTMNKVRKLKIYTKTRTNRWHLTTVPEIRLGFEEGEQVQIIQQRRKLTITVVKGMA